MNKFILIVFSVVDSKDLYAKVDSLIEVENGERANPLKIGTNYIFSFDSKYSMEEVKGRIDESKIKPLFFIIDITGEVKGKTFDLSFDKLESFVLKETNVVLLIENEKENYELNELLELVFKNGYESLTPKQKAALKKHSEGEDEKK